MKPKRFLIVNVKLSGGPRTSMMSKILSLLLCVFTLAALADTLPDPPATFQPKSRVRAMLRPHVPAHTAKGYAWSSALPADPQIKRAQVSAPVTAPRPRTLAWFSLAPSSARAPPRGSY
jgi:hypothetical protein